MKKIYKLLAFLLICSTTSAQIIKVEIMATGLTCSICSNAINKQLKTLQDVEKVDIDLNKNIFTVTLKSTNKLTPNDLKKKVESSGFFVGSMTLFMPFNNYVVFDNKQKDAYIFIDSKEQTVNGIVKLKVLDKGFVTAKEYKKMIFLYNKYATYNNNNDNDFHLKLL